LDLVRGRCGWVQDHPITVGGCIATSLTLVHVNVHGGGCVVVSTNGNVGGTATIGGGPSSALLSASVSGQGQISNCPLCGRSRWFVRQCVRNGRRGRHCNRQLVRRSRDLSTTSCWRPGRPRTWSRPPA
jgi:hypothetical protein